MYFGFSDYIIDKMIYREVDKNFDQLLLQSLRGTFFIIDSFDQSITTFTTKVFDEIQVLIQVQDILVDETE